ncbi:MAG: FadR family transcriptional regulator [Lachnospiraceae bacterium]|nr:FadR family transcriptional regulator [Lachnospiraceae bacterium]
MERTRENGKTYEYLFNYFSEQILAGNLKLNDKLPTEREIAEKHGISRNSVRETMHMLEIMGLIECVQGSGNYIRCDPMSYMLRSANMIMALMETDPSEIFYLRNGNEYAAVKLAVSHATKEELENMRHVLLEMEQPMSAKASARLDVEFHHRLVAASHNRILILYNSMLNSLLDQFIENFRTRILMSKTRAEALRRSHWGIYEGVADRDLPAALKALDRHFQIVGEQIKKITQKS